jgi:hypothetical protein
MWRRGWRKEAASEGRKATTVEVWRQGHRSSSVVSRTIEDVNGDGRTRKGSKVVEQRKGRKRESVLTRDRSFLPSGRARESLCMQRGGKVGNVQARESG